MSTQNIDYDALAKQAGATSSIDYDALAKQSGATGRTLAAPAVSKPTVKMESEPMSWPQQRIAQTAENAAEVAKHVAPIGATAANDIYDSSAPNIATELYKRLSGKPNNLREIPAKAVMTWLMAGGIPEGKGVEAAEAVPKAESAPAPVRQSPPLPEAFNPPPPRYQPPPGTADVPFQGPAAAAPVRPSPELPAAFQPLPARPPAVPGTVEAPFQGAPPRFQPGAAGSMAESVAKPPVDPLLARLRAIAADLPDESELPPEKSLTPKLRKMLRAVDKIKQAAAAPAVPPEDADLTSLLEQSLKRVQQQKAASQ